MGTYASNDIRDMTTLTPLNFLNPLVVYWGSAEIIPPAAGNSESLRLSWQKSRKLIDVFWSRWSKEYVQTLLKRNKWHQTKDNLYVGQIVLMVEENMTRDKWPLARVTAIESDSEHVRSVTVQTTNGRKYVRHVTKLVRLELD